MKLGFSFQFVDNLVDPSYETRLFRYRFGAVVGWNTAGQREKKKKRSAAFIWVNVLIAILSMTNQRT
jgi:hypothetical protein